jgi:hypothetical protein
MCSCYFDRSDARSRGYPPLSSLFHLPPPPIYPFQLVASRLWNHSCEASTTRAISLPPPFARAVYASRHAGCCADVYCIPCRLFECQMTDRSKHQGVVPEPPTSNLSSGINHRLVTASSVHCLIAYCLRLPHWR